MTAASDAPAGKQSAAGGLISISSSAEWSFLDSGIQKNVKKSSRLQRLRWPD